MHRHWPLVGREPELELISDTLRDRDVHGVVIAGAGGVGKTRLANEALALGRRVGFNTLSIQATRASADVPLGVFAFHLPGEAASGAALRHARDALLAGTDEAPLLLLVDDAHHLDPVSSTLILQLARDPRVFVVATIRTGEPVPDAVTSLWKDAGAARLDLRPFEVADAEALLEAALGNPVATTTVTDLFERCEGNALALLELARSAEESGHLRLDDDVWHLSGEPRLSGRIAEVIADRIGALDDPQRDALALAALGEPVRLVVLEDLVGRAPIRALDDRAILTIESHPEGDDRARPAHPLYGDVVVSDLGTLHKRQLLESLADAVTARGFAGDDDVLRVASWRLESGGEVDPDLLLRAARVGYVRTDYRRMAELAEASWQREETAAAGHLLGFALGRSGEVHRAEDVLAEATRLAADDRMRVLVALARSENLFRGLADTPRAVEVTADAERALADETWRDELRANRASFLMQSGEPEAAWELVEPLIGPGTAARPFVKAAYVAGPLLALDGQTARALDLAVRALPVHEQVWADDLFQTEPAVHHVTALLAHIEAGNLLQAEAYAEVALRTASELGVAYGVGFMATMSALVALRRGRIGTAGTRCREAVLAFGEAGYPGQRRWALGGAALVAAMLGKPEDAERYLEEADRLLDLTPVRFNEAPVDDARGWTLFAQGRPDEARRRLSEAADRAVEAHERAGAALLLHSLARLGGAKEAVGRLAALSAETDGGLTPLRHAHAEALVAGDGAALDEVAEGFSGIGADLYAAEAAMEGARRHRRQGDTRAATRSERRARELAERCEGVTTPPLVSGEDVEPLTDREREVAMLAATGLASKEIADRLTVSRRTVDNHLQRVYRKLGIEGRRHLGAALGHRG